MSDAAKNFSREVLLDSFGYKCSPNFEPCTKGADWTTGCQPPTVAHVYASNGSVHEVQQTGSTSYWMHVPMQAKYQAAVPAFAQHAVVPNYTSWEQQCAKRKMREGSGRSKKDYCYFQLLCKIQCGSGSYGSVSMFDCPCAKAAKGIQGG